MSQFNEVRRQFGSDNYAGMCPEVLAALAKANQGHVRGYAPEEVKAIGETCRRLGLRLHMDGARFANAVASLKASPGEVTRKAGVDILCLGGSKNGMGLGEAVVFFNKELAEEFAYRRKQ